MSTRAEMMAALAAIFDRPKSSVDAVDRVLTDAGLRTRAARGRAAQAMSAEDFANVTMGLMGGWSLRETPQMVERLGALHLRDGEMVEFDLEEDGEMMGIQGSADLTTHQILETNLPIQIVERLGALHLRDGEMVEFDLEEDGEMMGIQGSADLTTHQILETNLPI